MYVYTQATLNTKSHQALTDSQRSERGLSITIFYPHHNYMNDPRETYAQKEKRRDGQKNRVQMCTTKTKHVCFKTKEYEDNYKNNTRLLLRTHNAKKREEETREENRKQKAENKNQKNRNKKTEEKQLTWNQSSQKSHSSIVPVTSAVRQTQYTADPRPSPTPAPRVPSASPIPVC